jgi:hypothetical protein
VPRDGESLLSLLPDAERERRLQAAKQQNDGGRIPPNPMPPDTSEADRAWAVPRRMMQPLKTFEQPVRLSGAGDALPKTYIYCTRPGPGDAFRQFADRARRDPQWRYREIDASHNPHVTAPDTLAGLLHELVSDG